MEISEWIDTFSDKPKLLVIYGPTACGKTALTIELAKKHDGEVVIADSRQIYRGMDIGTGKITANEMQWVVHHMLDIRDISEMYGVGEFAPEARRIIADIHARGKLPILSGGTGLFIDSVVWNFTIPEVKADWGYREELETFREQEGDEALWEKLHEVDPLYADELDPRNYRYVIRALEIWKETGKSKKTLGQKTESPYDFLRITPYDGDREKLYTQINQRVVQMFEEGLVEEVQTLLHNYELRITNLAYRQAGDEWKNPVPSSSGKWVQAERHERDPGIQANNISNKESENWLDPRVKPEDDKTSNLDSTSHPPSSDLAGMTDVKILEKFPGLNAIGYREILPYLAGKETLEKTLELVQQNSRHYAKRQLTWFRRYASTDDEEWKNE